jgi:hypothetical protein
MYKIRIFSGGKIIVLQQQINEWLQANKDIVIHNSNVCGSNGENLGSNEYVFFILYSSSIVQQQELKEMAAAAMQEQSVEVKEN